MRQAHLALTLSGLGVSLMTREVVPVWTAEGKAKREELDAPRFGQARAALELFQRVLRQHLGALE